MIVTNSNEGNNTTLPNVLIVYFCGGNVELARQAFRNVADDATFVFDGMNTVKLDLYRASCNNHDNIRGNDAEGLLGGSFRPKPDCITPDANQVQQLCKIDV